MACPASRIGLYYTPILPPTTLFSETIQMPSPSHSHRPSTSASASASARPSSSSCHSLPSISTLKQGNGNGNAAGGCRQSLNQRRLMRQKKLRHVSDEDIGLSSAESSRSSPVSPDSSRNPRPSPGWWVGHWSSSAMPQPLPLPGSSVPRRSDSNPVEGVGRPFERYEFLLLLCI